LELEDATNKGKKQGRIQNKLAFQEFESLQKLLPQAAADAAEFRLAFPQGGTCYRSEPTKIEPEPAAPQPPVEQNLVGGTGQRN
jgi:hypothetical protein